MELAVALMLALASLALVWLLALPLAILILAFTIAQGLSPIIDLLTSWVSRTAAVVVVT